MNSNGKWCVTGLFLLCATLVRSQTTDTLPVQNIPEVTVKSYFTEQPVLSLPASIGMVDTNTLLTHPNNSLVSAVNTIPGVRMEERSPESYRLSIRGSVLRSPFGIRNIRIYFDDWALTDAGGDTYINLLDAGNVSHIEILKGPIASVYGANSGGVVLLNPVLQLPDSLSARLTLEGGSYGYFHEQANFQKLWKNYELNVAQTYQRSDGYRQNTATSEWTAQVFQRWQYSPKASLKIFLLYSNLYYQTPGGLTLQQFETNPAEARPATPTLPGAIQQQAAIYNQTYYAAIANEYNITNLLKWIAAVSAFHTDFKNPFITNYEKRIENTIDGRTYFDWRNRNKLEKFSWHWDNGLELESTWSNIANYGNVNGRADTAQAIYKFNAGQYFFFSRFSMDILQRLNIEAALSETEYLYGYKSTYPVVDAAFSRVIFKPQLMPRLALSYRFTPNVAIRASVSRGFSPPTIDEVHPSSYTVSTGLQAENGWSYETGIRLRDKQNYLWLDVAVYYYHLQNAIVQREDSADNDFFVNAGGTQQLGVESQLIFWLVKPRQHGFVRSLQLQNSYTFSYFIFSRYNNGAADYSGNHVTGVPPHVIVSSLQLQMPRGFYFFVEHSYVSTLPLDDANTAYAAHYNLLQAKAGWQHGFKHILLHLYAGGNNLLNQHYSLGDDLNALGARYYNAAPLVNFYAGISIGWR